LAKRGGRELRAALAGVEKLITKDFVTSWNRII
jgi:hypothetical protein